MIEHRRRVLFPVFSNYQVRIIFSDDLAKSYEKIFKRPLDRDVDMTNAFHAISKSGCSHLFFRIGNAPSGTIAHECVHVIWRLLIEWAGVTKMDDEVVAYHVGWLVQQVTNFRNELIDKKVGVKSETEVRTNGIGNSQESIGRMRRLQPGETAPGETRTS